MLLLTDVEPDDLWAFLLLTRHVPIPGQLFSIIVGEANATIKYRTMVAICQLLNIKAEILLGQSSDKVIANDGGEFAGIADLHDIAVPVYDPRAIQECIERHCKLGSPIVAIKPYWELMGHFDFSKNTLWYYGGFNNRQVLKAYSIDDVYKTLRGFKEVYLFEKFLALGSAGSITRQTVGVEEFIRKVDEKKETDILIKLIARYAVIFNSNLLEKEKSSAYKDAFEAQRAQQVIDAIEKHVNFQFLMADQALILCMMGEFSENMASGYLKIDVASKYSAI